MNDYLGRNNIDKKKDSVIDVIRKHRSKEREISKEKKEVER